MDPDLIAGRYRVQRAVGRGGMGTVWLCRDDVLGREVAVKQIGMLPGESATDAARALREARSSAALNHRNVVSVFDVVDDERGRAWLVMEYVPSRTLGEIVRDDGPLDPRRVAWIGAQVADGLAAAHTAGTIHRDVKPGNILVGDDDVAKITDFGIARRHDDDQLTRTGLVTGTPSYFAPELARGEDPAAEADVYALGASLYLAVEGRAPYPEERNPIALLQRIAAEEPAPPQRAGPLAGPISRMMDRDPHARWSMADAAGALRRVAEHEDDGAVAAEPTSVLASPATPAAPTGAHDTAPDDTADQTAAHDTAADQTGASEERRRSPAVWLVAAAALLLVVLAGGYLLTDDGPGPGSGEAARTAASPAETDTGAAGARPGSEQTGPSPEPERSEPEPEPEQSEPSPERTEPEPTPSPDETDADRAGDPAEAVGDYFSVVPDDTDAGWSRLAPSMQDEVGRDGYEAWWGSVDAVEVHSTETVGDGRVRVDLTYAMADGSTTRETQLLTLEQSGGGWLIADDEVLSSRSA